MDNRKRQRLEVTQSTTMPMSNVASATTQSFFLSTNPNDCGITTNNVLLTICTDDDDVHSDESQEYLAIDESLARIKQENSTATLPIHYRIVNPTSVTTTSESTQTNNSSVAATASMLPTSVQLPSGCDIYLVKEYMDSSSGGSISNCVPPGTTIKLETNEQITSAGCNTALQIVRSVPCLVPKNVHNSVTSTAISTAAGSAASAVGGNSVGADTVPLNKRSYILETYKKRDDKRRATHNEVERRRRDKINSWIFKLKEMLPEMPTSANIKSNVAINKSTATASVNTTTQERNNFVNNNGNCRTPPSDSKSQILIKACEYIKTMQEEIKSLRECLTENENLRSSNQRLQCELETLKNERQNRNANNSNNNNNNSYNITLNNLNNNGLFSTTPTGAGAYTKRELIIRDYVD